MIFLDRRVRPKCIPYSWTRHNTTYRYIIIWVYCKCVRTCPDVYCNYSRPTQFQRFSQPYACFSFNGYFCAHNYVICVLIALQLWGIIITILITRIINRLCREPSEFSTHMSTAQSLFECTYKLYYAVLLLVRLCVILQFRRR